MSEPKVVIEVECEEEFSCGNTLQVKVPISEDGLIKRDRIADEVTSTEWERRSRAGYGHKKEYYYCCPECQEEE
jgi:hypothetical protein